jgi:hypothetical protein
MAITINGSGTITGISTGGLPDGIVDDGTLATSAVTSTKILDGTILNADINASAAIAGSKLSGVGVTVATNWRQTGTTALATGDNYLTSQWEVIDTNSAGSLGSALTESSGVFTFPSTGVYFINYALYVTLENDETGCKSAIAVTTNNSSYTNAAYGSVGIQRSSGNYELSSTAQYLLDVTDTANVKVKFGYSAEVAPATSVVNGSTNNNRTNFIVLRLGDT